MSNIKAYSYSKDENAISSCKFKDIAFDFRGKKVIINGHTVALLDIDYEYEELNGCIMINTFEVFQKGIGLGTVIIKRLLDINRGKKFCLYSEPVAERFWKSMGFVLGDDGTGTDVYYYGL